MIRHVGDYLHKLAGRRPACPAGRFVIVGKGPTRFDFANLCEVDGPIVFLNDAVQLEALASNASERFFFAHDRCQAKYLTSGLQSTAVLPAAGAGSGGAPLLSVVDEPRARHVRNLVTYAWDQGCRRRPEVVASRSREEVARTGWLFVGPGTIHTAIHFAWLCGCRGIDFIGCDGFDRWDSRDAAVAYDGRIELASGGKPKRRFRRIRKVADWLCRTLGMEAEYVFEAHLQPQILRRAHFVWLGEPVPAWAAENVEALRRLHDGWDVTLWRALPADAPAWLRAAVEACELRCQQSDLLSYWLLYSRGGVYLDCDVLPLRSLEPLRRYEAFAAVQSDGRINCAVMGSVPHSTAFRLILGAAREVAATPPGARPAASKRTAYGPTLLSDLFGRGGERSARHLAVLPQHYFYLFRWHRQGERNEAHQFWRAGAAERKRMIAAVRDRVTDPVEPYCVHLWGVDGSGRRPACRTGRPVRAAQETCA